jgi:uncharacterized protein (TIGR01777 family)
MRVVLAGGSGFVGSALARVLLDAGHSVTILTRSVTRSRGRTEPRAEIVAWDARSPGPWEEVIDGADGVVNLTGEALAARRWSEEQKRRLRASRVEATGALVRAMANAATRPSVLVNASAVGYYGPHGDETLSEDAPPGHDFLASLCQEWEAAARVAEPLGSRVALMRLGVVLGEGGGVLAKMVPPFKLFAGGPLGSGRQWLSWVHRDDVVGLFRLALENDSIQGPVNVTAPEPLTMADFCRTLGRVLGRPSWAPVPASVLGLLMGEMADMVLTGQRVEPRAALRLGYRFRYPKLEPALRAILAK